MLRDRILIVLLLTFLVFSLAFASDKAKDDEPPPCSKPAKAKISSSSHSDDDGEDLPLQEEPQCIPPLEPTEEEDKQPSDLQKSAEEEKPDDGNDHAATNVAVLRGT